MSWKSQLDKKVQLSSRSTGCLSTVNVLEFMEVLLKLCSAEKAAGVFLELNRRHGPSG